LRALLIRLAVDAGRAITSDQLIEDIWVDAPPAAPGRALHTLVSRLRYAGGRDLVEATPGGYRLAVNPGEIDAVEFERLLVAARAEIRPADRAATLNRALQLWRGPALSDVADAAFAAVTIAKLEELRLAATEDRIDIDLTLGESTHAVAELEGLTAALLYQRHTPVDRG
jgi:DNA-binding SARP family transcriptional activator